MCAVSNVFGFYEKDWMKEERTLGMTQATIKTW